MEQTSYWNIVRETPYSDSDPNLVRILTHDGRFHADEVIACELLSLLEDNNVEIVRSRDTTNIDQYKWVVDVGKQYIPEHGRFDHHQEECKMTWPGYPILLSSSGMVFYNLWREILEKMGHPNATEDEAEMIYKNIFLPIDAHDNGQIIENYKFSLAYGHKGYGEGINIGRVISDMNNDDVNSDEQHMRFKNAMKYAFDSLLPVISNMMKTYRQNKQIIEKLKDVDMSLRFIILPKRTYVNQYILKHIDPNKKLLFTIYEKKQQSDGKKEWGFSAVQDTRFVNRADLVKEDKEKYPDLIFIHKKLFCGSASTLDEAIRVCNDSVKQHKRKTFKKFAMFGSGVLGLATGAYYLLK